MIHAAGFFIMYWQTAVTGRRSKQPHQLRVFHLHAPEVLHGDVLDLAHNARIHDTVAHDQDVLSLPQLRLDHFYGLHQVGMQSSSSLQIARYF